MTTSAVICWTRMGRKVRSQTATLAALFVVVVSSFALAACVDAPPEVALDDAELVQGRELYANNCVSCHGSDGSGGLGRKLSNGAVVEAFPNVADQISLIVDGKGTMPSFRGRLTDAEVQAVVRYTREIL